MARTRKRGRRKYGRRRRRSNPYIKAHRRRRPSRRRRSRRNPYVLGNRKRRRRRVRHNARRRSGRRRRRRNPFRLVMGNAPRRRRRRSRRRSNPYVLGNSRRRRRGRKHYRRNPAGLGLIQRPMALLRPATFLSSAKSFAMAAVPVGAGMVGVRLLDLYLLMGLHGKLSTVLKLKDEAGNVDPNKVVLYKVFSTVWDTFTHITVASVGGNLMSRFWRRPDTARLFAAGVAVNWLRKMAFLWLPEGQIKTALSGYELDDYVETVGYNLPNGNGHVADYGEGTLKDYVEMAY